MTVTPEDKARYESYLDPATWTPEIEREALSTPPHCVCTLHMAEAAWRLDLERKS